MKYDGYYLVEVLIPETFSLTTKMGPTNYYLCTKKDNKFYSVSVKDHKNKVKELKLQLSKKIIFLLFFYFHIKIYNW